MSDFDNDSPSGSQGSGDSYSDFNGSSHSGDDNPDDKSSEDKWKYYYSSQDPRKAYSDPSSKAPVNDNPQARERLAAVALFMGIGSVVSFQVFFISLPLGISAIVLALLSRGSGAMIRRARTAMIAGIVGSVVSVSVTGYAFYTVFTNPELRQQFESIYEYYTGQSFFSDADGGSLLPDPGQSVADPDAQALLQDILSGNYRREKNSDNNKDNSGLLSEDVPQAEDDVSGAGNSLGLIMNQSDGGGSYI